MNLIEHEYTRLLVVDDDLLLQAVLGQFLCLQGFHVTPAEHGEAAKTILLEQRIQLVILDIIMPDKDGLYWLQWIKENCPSLPVLILSSQSSDQDRIKGLELGADDYLTKPFHPKELLIRVSNLLRTHPNANPSASNKTFQIGNCLFDPKRELLIRCDDLAQVHLTSTQTRLLLFFCTHPDTILTRDAISHALHEDEHHPLDRKIDMQINRLRKKVSSILDVSLHLYAVWRKGYRFTP